MELILPDMLVRVMENLQERLQMCIGVKAIIWTV